MKFRWVIKITKVVMQQITLDGLNDTSIVDSTEPTSTLIAVYFFDVN